MPLLTLPGPARAVVESPHYKWWVYAAVALGTYFTVVDQTGINIALPFISDQFGLDIPTVQWTLLAYVLTTAIMFMPIGRLADIIGRKNVFLVGLSINIIGAAIAGTATIFPIIVLGKVIQGIGVAGIQGNGMAIIASNFPDSERGKSIGLYTAIIGSGLTSGPIIGGFLVHWLSWRAVFLANVPVGVLAISLALLTFKPMVSGAGGASGLRTFDWRGAALSAGAFVGFLMAMSNGHRFGWSSTPILVSFAAAGVLFAAFIWWQLKATYPMLDLSLFRSKVMAMAVSARTLNFLATSSVAFLMPFYIINVMGYSPDRVGLLLAPGALCMGVIGPFSGYLSDRFGSRITATIGQSFEASALFSLSQLSPDSSPGYVLMCLVLAGIGAGFFNASNGTAIMSYQDPSKFGIVAALLNVIRTSANITGIAVGTTIVTIIMASHGHEPKLPLTTGDASPAINSAFVSGLNLTYLIAGSLLLVSIVLSALHGSARRGVGVREKSLARTRR